MKKVLLTFLFLVFSFNVFSSETDEKKSSYVLVSHNIEPATLTKLTVSKTLEQCEIAKRNFEKVYTNNKKFKLSCIGLPDQTM